MSDPQSSVIRPIAHYQIMLPSDWYAVPVGDGGSPRWASELAAELTTDVAAARSLSERLSALRGRLVRNSDVVSTAAAYIPHPQTGLIACALAFQVTPVAVAGTAGEFQDSLNEEAATWQPGAVFRANSTWRRQVPAGELVGSTSLIAHRDPGEEQEHLEQRAVFAVYPPASSDLVQFIFSTQDLGAFEDMAQSTEALVASLEVDVQTNA